MRPDKINWKLICAPMKSYIALPNTDTHVHNSFSHNTALGIENLPYILENLQCYISLGKSCDIRC